MALYLLKHEGHLEGHPKSKNVLKFIEIKKLILLRPEDFDENTDRSIKWHAALRYACISLRDECWVKRPSVHDDDGFWIITEAGEREAASFILRLSKFAKERPNWKSVFEQWLSNYYTSEKIIITEDTMQKALEAEALIALRTPLLIDALGDVPQGRITLRDLNS